MMGISPFTAGVETCFEGGEVESWLDAQSCIKYLWLPALWTNTISVKPTKTNISMDITEISVHNQLASQVPSASGSR